MWQQTFFDAHYKSLLGFSVSNDQLKPEYLNEVYYSINAYCERMKPKLENRKGVNWDEGYEEGWLKILKDYNSGEGGYPKAVLNFSKDYLPKN